MSARDLMTASVGEWAGSNRVWLSPDAPPRESDTTATIELAAGDGTLHIQMDDITPGGEEALAVETLFTRVTTG